MPDNIVSTEVTIINDIDLAFKKFSPRKNRKGRAGGQKQTNKKTPLINLC